MSQILSFSGHRFPNAERLSEAEMLIFLSFLKKQLQIFFDTQTVAKYKLENISAFVCGGQVGFDFAAQQFTIEASIPLVIALPYNYNLFTARWDSDKFRKILSQHMAYATDIVIVDTEPYYKHKYGLSIGEYHVAKLQWRNQYMIDNSDTTIFYLNPATTKGGTCNAFKYCQKIAKPHYNMWTEFNEYLLLPV